MASKKRTLLEKNLKVEAQNLHISAISYAATINVDYGSKKRTNKIQKKYLNRLLKAVNNYYSVCKELSNVQPK